MSGGIIVGYRRRAGKVTVERLSPNGGARKTKTCQIRTIPTTTTTHPTTVEQERKRSKFLLSSSW